MWDGGFHSVAYSRAFSPPRNPTYNEYIHSSFATNHQRHYLFKLNQFYHQMFHSHYIEIKYIIKSLAEKQMYLQLNQKWRYSYSFYRFISLGRCKFYPWYTYVSGKCINALHRHPNCVEGKFGGYILSFHRSIIF